MADSKNYQKTQSRTISNQKSTQKTISEQTVKYLVMNPLAVNYIIKQETQTVGDNTTIHAKLQYNTNQ